ncbi:breakpoint cluster region protein-like isoform X2 [Mercenaria mercenaria]|uniref:breakpoint cluster region protein-like isoform X2 n=1 Tax=Mercenaria mercenaria TaxID=6596 RepID=UPI00234FA13C|nr:breakpoint cluster region protein-like isoform X2 [Mercenaria mercenaria]
MEETKSAWKDKFSSNLPPEFISRLECELSKCENDPGAGDHTHALSCAMDITKSRIRELNKQLRNEEFFYEVISSVVSARKRSQRNADSDKVDVSAMYAKVNKPTKLKIDDSPVLNHAKSMSDQAEKNSNHERLLSQTSHTYEEIGFQNSEIPDTKVEEKAGGVVKKKLRASVKDKIKMFERSDSSSGEDNINSPEGDYARLVIKPSVSPKPSPASRRRPRANEYEEISLPCFASNKKPDDPSNSKIQCPQMTPNIDKPDKTYAEIESLHDSSSKQEGYASLSDQPLENKSFTTQHQKRPAPPVPSRKSRGKDTDKSDNDVLKNTEASTLKYSDHEPQLSSSLKHKQINEDTKNHNDASDKLCGKIDGSIEGDYCSIKSVNTDNKHVTLVQVTSANGSGKNTGNKNFSVLSISGSERELSRSTEDLRNNKTGKLRRSSSKSFDDINQEGHYAEVEYSSINPVSGDSSSSDKKMKKLFGLKNGSDLETDPDNDSKEQIVGKQYKSLSNSSGSEEEDLMSTVVVNFENTEDQKKESSENKVLTSKDKRRGVPDYEKWTFQTLLTSTGISVAENGNLTDTGSDDETPYDNIDNVVDKHEAVSGQSDDSGVCESTESSLTPDDKEKLYEEVYEPRKKETDKQNASRSQASSSSVGSRFSSASCVTVDGDAVFMQRSDSVEGQPTIPEDEDTVSIYSNDDLGERAELEEEVALKYKSEQLHMRHIVVKGILESEKSYLHVIEQLVKAKHYLQSVSMSQGSQANIMSLEDITTIFYKMDDFFQIHKEFVEELTAKVKDWSDLQRIAEAVKRLVVYFKIYEEYVNNYPKAVETIRKYQKNEETRHLLEEQLETYKEEALKLEDVLLKPVQRIQTNHLVLHDLIKHTPENHPDYKDLKKALKLSEENLRMCNAHPGNLGSNKNQEARQLVKSGFLVEVSRDKKATRQLRYVFLFSDVIICTKHKGSSKYKDVSFKYVWYLPIPALSMHVRGDQKYQPKESLDDLKCKIGSLKVELREEMVRADSTKDKAFSITQKRAARNIEKLKKKIQEQEATLVEALPRLPLHLEVEGFRPHTFLFSTDYEREEWREALESQHIKCEGTVPAQLSNHDIDVMINTTKLHMQVNGIGTALLKKDEEMLNGSLNVTIHKMQGLEKHCDVYCCMEMDSYGHFYKKAQTRVSQFTTDASWNQDFELDLDGSQTLRILCYRKQPGNEDDVIIGKCALELSLSWLNSKFNEKTISMNEISITISIRHTPASKTLKRTQSKLRTGIFGVRIENVLRRESKTVPSIVTTCVQQVESRGMDEVGIYRVSGVTSDVQHFKKLFDKNAIAANVQAEEADIHAITGVLKLYFRELPEPLFTDDHYQSFIQTIQLQNEEAKEKCMLELLHSLPEANYYTIVFMIEHLVRVAKKSPVNKMSQSNLATIFGPTLMHPAMQDTNPDPMVQMAQAAKDASVQSEVVYFFIKLAASGKNIRKSATTEISSL